VILKDIEIVIVRVKRSQNNPTCLTNVNDLQENQRNQFVWEPLKIFKFGVSQVFMSFEVRFSS
jgi:hypothetical protein